MTTTEFSRLFDVRQCEGKAAHLVASADERAALAARFGLVRIDRLEADLLLSRDDRTVDAAGTLVADIVQPCAVSAEDLAVSIHEEIAFRFVPEAQHTRPDEEIELSAEDCDEIEYTGTQFDLGEAVSQSLALAIDPFATGPAAEATRRDGIISSGENLGPFAALKGLNL